MTMAPVFCSTSAPPQLGCTRALEACSGPSYHCVPQTSLPESGSESPCVAQSRLKQGVALQAQQETEAAIQDGNRKYSDMLAQRMTLEDELHSQIEDLKLQMAGKDRELAAVKRAEDAALQSGRDLVRTQSKQWDSERSALEAQLQKVCCPTQRPLPVSCATHRAAHGLVLQHRGLARAHTSGFLGEDTRWTAQFPSVENTSYADAVSGWGICGVQVRHFQDLSSWRAGTLLIMQSVRTWRYAMFVASQLQTRSTPSTGK